MERQERREQILNILAAGIRKSTFKYSPKAGRIAGNTDETWTAAAGCTGKKKR